MPNLNWVDWAVLVLLLVYMITGINRGFLMGSLDLLGMAVSLAIAVISYRPVSSVLTEILPFPKAVVILGAFLGLVLLAQVIYSLIVNLLFHLSRPLMTLFGPVAFLDQALGAVPGVVKGFIFATLALLPFALYPLLPQVSAGVERSSLGSRMVVTAVEAAPGLEKLMGRELNEGLTFLTPPQTEEGMKINFGMLGQLTPDPAAEDQLLKLVNFERQKVGMRPLEFDEKLRQVAREHSMEMFRLGYFAHNSPVTGTPFDRMRKSGIGFLIAGENLAYAPNVDIAHDGLMNSPGHKANILRSEFGKVGIGVIKSEFRGSMFSQEFMN